MRRSKGKSLNHHRHRRTKKSKSISFTTPEKERKEFFKEAVKLYERSKYNDVVKWAEYELALSRSDTVHDFLAHLSEQMIELNKVKVAEIKGFLTWLEQEIGAEVENLANKIAIKEYHEHSFLLDEEGNNIFPLGKRRL
ncbi:MAG: hypothetical protein Q8N09_06940 [Thermodesulfovibrionia bacterium]|nr:hypothetical protein [Thermodesulfovibrionia bacterium]